MEGRAILGAMPPNSPRVVHVHVHVKPESVEAFREATLANASQSVKEPGIAHFDVMQDTPMMAKPRRYRKYTNCFPADGAW